jgi:hypothetical protein
MDSTNLSKLWDGWTPPEGLNRSRPRPVVLNGRGIMLHVLAVLMLLGGVAGAVWIARESRRQQAQARLMVAEGRETAGVVTRLWRSGGKSDEHRVAYRFAVDGLDRNGHANLGSGYWNSLRVGSPITVRYLPSAPARNFPAAQPPSPTPSWMALLVGGMGLLAGGLLPLQVRRQRHLLEDGRPAPAVVTRQRRWHTQHGTQNTVYYQFALPDGGIRRGRANVHGKSMPGVDSVICVLYDPDNPRRSAPYPLCTVKLDTN